MPRRLSAAGEAALDSKDIKYWYRVKINDIENSDVISYSYSVDRNFGATSLELILINENGKYSEGKGNEIKFGDIVTLEEGIYNANNELESFTKFKGIVRQVSPQSESGLDQIRITALDYICKLEDMDLDKFYESNKVKVYAIDLNKSTGGVKLLESEVTSNLKSAVTAGDTTIYLESVSGFDIPPAGYSAKARIQDDEFEYTGVDVTNSALTGCTGLSNHNKGEIVRQKASETVTTRGKGFFYDFGYWSQSQGGEGECYGDSEDNIGGESGTWWFHRVKNISPTVQPIIVLKPKGSVYEEESPTWEGWQINYPEGQLVFNSPIDVQNYEVWAYFYFYPTSTMSYAEDIIEDIILQPDGYNNTVFTEDNIKTTLYNEDGISYEGLTYNRTKVVINNIEYDVGRVWYFKYSNIITTLQDSDFTLPPGKTILSKSQRYGRIILNSTVTNPSDGDVRYNKSYEFKTIQATGIKIPFFRVSDQKIANRFEALQELRKLIQPNYILHTSGDGKIWGRNMQQKYTEDYELKLKSKLNYTQDLDIYTRCKFYGYSGQPYNIMLKEQTSSSPLEGDSYVSFAANMPLELYRTDGTWAYFRIPVSTLEANSVTEILTSPDYPVIWIEGVRNSTWVADKLYGQNWAYLYDEITTDEETQKIYSGFWFHRAIDFNSTIRFWQGDVLYALYEVNKLKLVFDYDKQMYRWRPLDDPYITNKALWDSTMIQSITSIDFNIRYSDAWEYIGIDGYYGNYCFRVKQSYLPVSTSDQNDMSVWQVISGYTGAIYSTNETYWQPYQEAAGGVWDDIWGYPLLYDNTVKAPSDWNQLFRRVAQVRYCNVIPCPLGINGKTQLPWVQVCVFVKNRAYSIISGLRIYHYGDDPDKFYDKMVSDGGHEIDRTVISRRQEGDYIITTYRFNRWVYSDRIYLVWWNESRNVNCKIAEIELLKPPLVPTVTADFWYRKHLQKPQNIERLYDGLWTTQVQTISYSKPLKSFLYAVFEFKNYIDKNNKEYSGQPIDAIDITGGWYIPSGAVGARKYETKARYTIKYNTDGSNIYFPISAETTNFELSSGETKSFEREVLGEDFVAKRLALYVEDIEPIEDLGLTKWVISLVEFACYRNIYLVGETKLIPTTKLTQATNYGDTTIYVKDTGAFPSAGTAYLDDTLFTYTGKTATSFTGCSGIVEKSVNTRVSQYLEEKTNPLHPRYGWIYDPDHLLVKVGDRVYKDTEINKYLNTEQIIKDYSKMFLRELSNNISKANVTVVARPDAVIGDSVLVSDTVNLGEDKIYFVEGIDTSTEGGTNFKLSRYADYVYL